MVGAAGVPARHRRDRAARRPRRHPAGVHRRPEDDGLTRARSRLTGRMLPLAELHLHIEGTLEADLLVRAGPPQRRAAADVRPGRADGAIRRLRRPAGLPRRLLRQPGGTADRRRTSTTWPRPTCRAPQPPGSGARRSSATRRRTWRNGVPLEAVFGGLGAALEEARGAGLSADLIVCFLRDLGGEAAEDLLRRALPFRRALHRGGAGLRGGRLAAAAVRDGLRDGRRGGLAPGGARRRGGRPRVRPRGARRARRRADRPRQPRPRGPRPGGPAARRAGAADRVPAVERRAQGRARGSRPTHCRGCSNSAWS